MDVKMLGVDNLIALASFGVSTQSLCDYGPYTGPIDGRLPLPSLAYYSGPGLIASWYAGQAGQEVTQTPYSIGLNEWHHIDFLFTASLDGAYDWELLVDGQSAVSGRSFEPILENESLGVMIGAPGSFVPTDVEYDNIRVVLEEACLFGPEEQPLIFTREAGQPQVQSFTWESCGGPGILAVTTDRVASAFVSLNGVTILSPNQFNNNVTQITLPVELVQGNNVITVDLRGKPGSTLSLFFSPTP
jgi:hypothetical protein